MILVVVLAAGCGARQEPASVPSSVPQTQEPSVRGTGLIVSTVDGKADEVATAVTALGGRVVASDASVGYLRVSVPSDVVSKVKALPGVTAVQVEGLVDRGGPPS
ncbi:hypothetical protein EV192_1011632 [Actinocrispum wychmicini]|uniref:Putative peptidase inhibitor domain-containing protein n=1 Tax=Actinocrispum wychmicini TaxID=1213861 RepID=A0A4V2S927_9PSEU|nr:hypothetical protein EV192_1011632 [Actinocrispum wychmicini]